MSSGNRTARRNSPRRCYELAPLSYLYVVYGRGGLDSEPGEEGARGLLRDSFELRDDDQLLVKFSYRFEK